MNSKDQNYQTPPDPTGGEKSPNWQSSLRCITVIFLIITVGFSTVTPFTPLFIQELGGVDSGQAALWAGTVSGATALVMMFISPVWGTLSDWFGHKRNVLRACFAASGIMAVTATIQNIPQFLIRSVGMGAFTGATPAIQGLTGALVPRAHLAYSIGLLQTASALGTTLGPTLGGRNSGLERMSGQLSGVCRPYRTGRSSDNVPVPGQISGGTPSNQAGGSGK